jgi:hypothetical protein
MTPKELQKLDEMLAEWTQSEMAPSPHDFGYWSEMIELLRRHRKLLSAELATLKAEKAQALEASGHSELRWLASDYEKFRDLLSKAIDKIVAFKAQEAARS